MMEIVANAAVYTDLMLPVQQFCKEYSDNFESEHDSWMKMDGYRLKAEAAQIADYHLAHLASIQGNEELKNTYYTRRDFCLSELRRINLEKRW